MLLDPALLSVVGNPAVCEAGGKHATSCVSCSRVRMISSPSHELLSRLGTLGSKECAERRLAASMSLGGHSPPREVDLSPRLIFCYKRTRTVEMIQKVVIVFLLCSMREFIYKLGSSQGYLIIMTKQIFVPKVHK